MRSTADARNPRKRARNAVATKTCPSCGAEVPAAATRCKHCFHDFTAEPPRKNGLLIILGFLAVMVTIGFGSFAYVFHFTTADKYLVDAETKSIIVTRKSASNDVTSDRVTFDQVKRIEYVVGGEKSTYEIVAVTNDNDRLIIARSNDNPLEADATHYGNVMGKPVETVKNVSGFGEK